MFRFAESRVERYVVFKVKFVIVDLQTKEKGESKIKVIKIYVIMNLVVTALIINRA